MDTPISFGGASCAREALAITNTIAARIAKHFTVFICLISS
jgi:hypothetical protein